MSHPPSSPSHLLSRRFARAFTLICCAFGLACVGDAPNAPVRELSLSENADGDCELWIASCTHRALTSDERANIEAAMGYIDIENYECYEYYRAFEALLDGDKVGAYDMDDGAVGWHHDESDSGAGTWDGYDTDFNSHHVMEDPMEVAKTVIHETRHHFGESHARWGQFADGDDRCIVGAPVPDPR